MMMNELQSSCLLSVFLFCSFCDLFSAATDWSKSGCIDTLRRFFFLFLALLWIMVKLLMSHNLKTVPTKPNATIERYIQSYLASWTQPPACCSDSRKCPKSPLAPTDFGTRHNGDVASTCIPVWFYVLSAFLPDLLGAQTSWRNALRHAHRLVHKCERSAAQCDKPATFIDRTQLTTPATIDVPWRNLSPQFGKRFPIEVPSF